MLTAFARRDLSHIKLELRRIAFLTSTSRGREKNNVDMITEAFKDQHLALGTQVNQQFQDIGQRLDALSEVLLNVRVPGPKNSDDPPAYSEKLSSDSKNIEAVQVFLSARSTCRGWCPCTCHAKRTALRTPKIMESLLGRLFMGYTGLPILNNSCDFTGCKDRQQSGATVEYWFPWWFVSMNMKLQLKLIQSAGPQLQLSTTRRVADSSPSITYAMQGNIEGLRHLFTAGLAGPRDVSDSRGYSLMRVSTVPGTGNWE